MAGAEKKFPAARAESKLPRRDGDTEAKTKTSSAERLQRQDGMTKKMDTGDRQDIAVVDRWFDRQLNQLYSDVISEPLPKEFLDLIEKLREKTPK